MVSSRSLSSVSIGKLRFTTFQAESGFCRSRTGDFPVWNLCSQGVILQGVTFLTGNISCTISQCMHAPLKNNGRVVGSASFVLRERNLYRCSTDFVVLLDFLHLHSVFTFIRVRSFLQVLRHEKQLLGLAISLSFASDHKMHCS